MSNAPAAARARSRLQDGQPLRSSRLICPAARRRQRVRSTERFFKLLSGHFGELQMWARELRASGLCGSE